MRRRTLVPVILALAVLSPRAFATDIGVGSVKGGELRSLDGDPNSPTTAYAGVHGSGLYKTTNDGVAWSQIFLPSIASHFAYQVLASKSDVGSVFVCEGAPSSAAIWMSSNGAASFAGVLDAQTGPGGSTCVSMAEGITAGTYYAGVANGGFSASGVGNVLKSTDGGRTWIALSMNVTGSAPSSLVQLPGGRIVAGLRDMGPPHGLNLTGGMMYSDNEGATWTSVSGITGATLGLAKSAGTTVMAVTGNATNTYLYKSTDGAAWTLNRTVATVTDLVSQPIKYVGYADSFFALLGNDQLYESTVAPYTFAASTDRAGGLASPVPLSVNHHGAFAILDSTSFLMGDVGGDGIFRSTDAGVSWATSNDGLFSPEVKIALKNRGSAYRYGGNSSGYVYFAGSGLGSFKTIFRPTDITHESVTTLAYDIAAPRRIFAASGNYNDYHQLKVADDAIGAAEDANPFPHLAWRAVNYPPVPTTQHVFAILVDNSNLYAGISQPNNASSGNYLYKSTNGGVSWAPVSSLSVVGGVRTLAWDSASAPSVIYAGSGDYGSTIDPGSPAHTDGLWKTTNGGTSWSHLNSNPAFAAESPRTISIDPGNPQRVWVMADKTTGNVNNDNELWESVDGGASWTNITPSNVPGGRFAMAYTSSADLLVVSAGGNGINIYLQTPGSGSTLWDPGFGVYGEASALYNGSIGLATATGLYEATNVTHQAGPTPTPGGSPTPTPPPGGHHKGGCGCDLGGDAGADLAGIAGALSVLSLAASAAWRRRRAA